MKLATTTADYRAFAASQEEAIRHISSAGFRYLDYDFCTDYNDQNGIYANDWREHMARVKALAEELGILFVQAHAPMGRPIVRGDGYQPFIDATNRSIECAAMLGVKNIVVHSGYELGLTKEECFARNKEFFDALLPTAEQYGVNILVENFNKMCVDGMYWIDNAPDLRAFIDYMDHPLVHACWDVGHGNMQEMPQDESLRILGHHVYALHIQDNYGNADQHLAPFFGSMNLDSLMHGLQEIGYKGYFTFEACRFFLPEKSKRPYDKDTRLLKAPIDLMDKAEAFLYEIGKTILSAYDCYEE